MSDLTMLPDMAKEPGQESIVTNSRSIAHHCNMWPCPCNSYIHAPSITKEPYCSQGVWPNLTQVRDEKHFQYFKKWPINIVLGVYVNLILCLSPYYKNRKHQKKSLPWIWQLHLLPDPGRCLLLKPQHRKPLDILLVFPVTVVLVRCKGTEQQSKLERLLHKLVQCVISFNIHRTNRVTLVHSRQFLPAHNAYAKIMNCDIMWWKLV